MAVNWLHWSVDCLTVCYIGVMTVCQLVTLEC